MLIQKSKAIKYCKKQKKFLDPHNLFKTKRFTELTSYQLGAVAAFNDMIRFLKNMKNPKTFKFSDYEP
jgi:hypothetical protein